MGVRGLWTLLLPIGHRISIETLQGKTLAIDASIWITQFIKAIREDDVNGNYSMKHAAHLIGFMRRICKLLYHGIKPVIVFDGVTPEIKKKEVRARMLKRKRLLDGDNDGEVKRMAKRILLEELKKMKKLDKATENNTSETIPKTETKNSKVNEEEEVNEEEKENEEEKVNENSRGNAENAIEVIDIQSDDEKEKKPKKKVSNTLYSYYNNSNLLEKSVHDLNEIKSLFSSLPSNTDRKDKVDDIFKQQRIKTRKEYMPVAGNPEAYSQVQLKNFLKSTKLNRNINKVAKEIKKSTRNEDAEEEDIIYYDDCGVDKNKIREEALYEEADEDQEDFYNENQISSSATCQMKLRRLKKISYADAQNEDVEEEAFHNSKEKEIKSNGHTITHIDSDNENDVKIEPGNEIEEEEEEEGGFFRSDDSLNETTEMQKQYIDENSSKAHINFDTKNNIMVGIDTGEEEDEVEEGGFFRSDDSADQIKTQNDSVFEGSENQNLGQMTSETDCDEMMARLMQEEEDQQKYDLSEENEHENTNDELLALAIQESVDSIKTTAPKKNSKISNNDCTSNSFSNQILNVDEGSSKENETREIIELDKINNNESNDRIMAKDRLIETNIEENHSNIEPLENNSDEESIDWEEGDDASEENDIEQKSNKKEIPVNDDSSRNNYQDIDIDMSQEVKANELFPAFMFQNSPNGHSNQNAIYWEEVEKENEKEGEENIEYKNGIEEIEKEERVEILKHKSKVEISLPLVEGEPTLKLRNKKEHKLVVDVDDNENSFSQANNSTVVALQNAQETAANLTNWAGRAVQRAIAEFGKTQPTLIKDKLSPQNKSKKDMKARIQDIVDDEDDATDMSNEKKGEYEHNAVETFQANHNPQSPSNGKNLEIEEYNSSFFDFDNNNNSNSSENFTQQPKAYIPSGRNIEEEEGFIRDELRREARDLDGKITEEMKEEIIQLIELFGVPYVNSPSEAEAQCAKLENLGLVDGVVTEDSDAFVFGAEAVYKNIFDSQKFVEVYMMKDARNQLSLDKNEMVALAMLLGGDYTEGVKGIGIVNGMEILRAFSMKEGVKEGLSLFRYWLNEFNDPTNDANSPKKSSTVIDENKLILNGKRMTEEQAYFHNKHRTARLRWVPPKDFPAANVLNAYLRPVVDVSEAKFSWGYPDFENIYKFCYQKIGWYKDQTGLIIGPLIQKLSKGPLFGSRQTRIDSFFMRYEDNHKFADIKSKRLKEVMLTIQNEKKSESKKKRRF